MRRVKIGDGCISGGKEGGGEETTEVHVSLRLALSGGREVESVAGGGGAIG